MSLTVNNQISGAVVALHETATDVVAVEAMRMESEFERLQNLETSIPDLIRRNGELLAALVIAQGECGNLESAHRARVEALRAEIVTLGSSITDQQAKVARFEPLVAALQQNVDFMNSPAGHGQAWNEKHEAVWARLRASGVL